VAASRSTPDADSLQMPRLSRILLKLSGEVLRDGEDCFAPAKMKALALALADVRNVGVQVAVVVGGGNILRGRAYDGHRARADVDQIGMLATVLNVGMLRFHLEDAGQVCRVFAARAVPPVAEAFERRTALAALENGEVVLLGGGTGNPFFSTDSAAALRAIELDCDAVLKGTMVDGVYDKDPHRHPDATRFDRLSYDEVLRRDLKVMDQTAIALCRDAKIRVIVFDLTEPAHLLDVVLGRLAGSVIGGETTRADA
jgi:uridylate kinase